MIASQPFRPTPTSRITLGALSPGRSFDANMDGKGIHLEHHPDKGLLHCTVTSEEGEKSFLLEEGSNEIWRDPVEERWIEVVVDGGGVEILGYQPKQGGTRTFAQAHATAGQAHAAVGAGFPFGKENFPFGPKGGPFGRGRN